MNTGFNRFPTEHEIVGIPNYEGIAWDDIWRFNPQACSQWDGFRHFSTVMEDGSRRWYGGTTPDEISEMKSSRIGVGHWAQDGIAARGVLIDYVSYCEKKGMSSMAHDVIPLSTSECPCIVANSCLFNSMICARYALAADNAQALKRTA